MDNIQKTNKLSELIFGRLYCIQDTEPKGISIDPLPMHLWLYSPLLDLGRFFSFLTIYTVGMTPWAGDRPVATPLPAHKTTKTQNKHKKTSIP
jgi:hypothetical protein